ncbi:MAG: prepilin-type N-terminal cleavage/methylation domain-containing protein [Rubrivivax sp.]|nr:prepilin-type N-terminal cleavage/methylation domain-containing protein [Pseudomonadota bacterium]MCW5638913.1 prepilin-type N-terminal cleavage/methylation domain-containing protein [Rubrivivax sp.]HRY89376.1 prepilin-type N-terminal cleavage/methylation domain-containing protein [Rubrivivax sp.]
MKSGCSAQRPHGVSLIELMVGLTLGLIVVLVAGSMFVGSSQASRTTAALGSSQETARNAFELIARDLREAGGTPCDNRLLVANVLNNAQAAPATWWADWNQPLQGFDGATAFPGAAFGTGVGDRVAGTGAVIGKYVADLTDLTVVAHDVASAQFTVNNNPPRARAGDLLMVCHYGQAAVLQASAVGAGTIDHAKSAAVSGNCSRGLGIPTLCTATGTSYTFAPGSKIGRFAAVGWYVGNNGRAETGGRSLYRVTRNGAEEVAEGIQDLQLEFLSAGGTAYSNAAGVADWDEVVAVRIALTLRSAQANVSTQAGGRLERPVNFTLFVRNRQP